MCISYIENESRNTSRKLTQNALPWLDLPGFELFIFVRGSRQNQKQSITQNYFCPQTKVIKYSVHPTMHLARDNCKRLIG